MAEATGGQPYLDPQHLTDTGAWPGDDSARAK